MEYNLNTKSLIQFPKSSQNKMTTPFLFFQLAKRLFDIQVC
ncbi:hypothetical protein BGP_0273 [Beggiatoa sp. PS]|nr:hypothetical protein BGP_0273 [Beggiatoa sp. PS]